MPQVIPEEPALCAHLRSAAAAWLRGKGGFPGDKDRLFAEVDALLSLYIAGFIDPLKQRAGSPLAALPPDHPVPLI